jgi:hypothetical protein
MYRCTGASPWALAICGFPPLKSRGFAVLLALDRRDERLPGLALALLGMATGSLAGASVCPDPRD